MSSRDHDKYGAMLDQLAGRKCFLTLATNSLKLHLDENKPYGSYLWIDPPWQFGRHEEIIESSLNHPHHEDENYARDHQTWSSHFTPLRENVIEEIESSPDGSLWIRFSKDYAIFVPAGQASQDPDEDNMWWYDHWYVSSDG